MAKEIKSTLHKRNRHRAQYDFEKLTAVNPKLDTYVHKNKYGTLSIDFFNAHAVKALNTALLLYHYDLQYWDIPKKYLCPAVPGRADYIHYVADLFPEKKRRSALRCLDIGVGANCVYPIVGTTEYGWEFIGTDIDKDALRSAQKIIDNNPTLKNKVTLRHQENSEFILRTVIDTKERFDLLLTNPPFHASKKEADKAALRKLNNLKGKGFKETKLNFEGQSNELWTEGGEQKFITKLIHDTYMFRKALHWCTCLVSKEKTLAVCERKFKKIGAVEKRILEIGTANKKTRILAWRWKKEFLEKKNERPARNP